MLVFSQFKEYTWFFKDYGTLQSYWTYEKLWTDQCYEFLLMEQGIESQWTSDLYYPHVEPWGASEQHTCDAGICTKKPH